MKKDELALMFAFFVFLGIFILTRSLMNGSLDRFNEMTTLIEQGKYAEAVSYIESVNCEDKYNVLYSYARCQQCKNEDVVDAYFYIRQIPKTYNGIFADEIKMLREECEQAYDEYHAAKKKQQEDFENALKSKLPEIGLEEKYIDMTILGKHSSSRRIFDDLYGRRVIFFEYSWGSEVNFGEIAYTATCLDGKVWRTEKSPKYNIRYNSDGTVEFIKIPNSKTIYQRIEYPSNKYNVYDYHDPEDFYYDNEEDFYDNGDAEEYFDDAWS
ncbi:MAG: hypothetical protein NC244_07670 [Alistipes senegalensis]|nr:hypothetical protein [Alistipes senegalensis]